MANGARQGDDWARHLHLGDRFRKRISIRQQLQRRVRPTRWLPALPSPPFPTLTRRRRSARSRRKTSTLTASCRESPAVLAIAARLSIVIRACSRNGASLRRVPSGLLGVWPEMKTSVPPALIAWLLVPVGGGAAEAEIASRLMLLARQAVGLVPVRREPRPSGRAHEPIPVRPARSRFGSVRQRSVQIDIRD